MRNSILKKITIVMAVALLVLTVLTVGAFIIVSMNDGREQIDKFAEISIEQIEKFESINDLDKFVYYKEGSNIKITIISSDGDVLRDTEGKDTLITQDLTNDEDIKSLIKAEAGTSKNKVESPYKDTYNMLTTYVKVTTSEMVDPEGFLIVRFSKEVILGSSPFWILVISMCAFWIIMVASIAVIFSYNINASMAPLTKVQDIMKDIKVGNYRPRDREHKLLDSKADEMVNEIDSLGEIIDDSMKELKVEKNKSEILLKSVQQGVLALDKDAKVIIDNEMARKLLGFKATDKQDFYEAISDKDIIEKIRSSFKTRLPCVSETIINNRIIKVETVFSEVENDLLEGIYVLIVLTDVTDERNSEKIKSEFFANASHELKTPLTAITGYSEILSMESITEKQIKKCSKEINDNAKRMKSLIDGMLDISKMDAQMVNPEEEEFSLRQLVEEVVNDVSVIAKNRNLTITIDGDVIMHSSYKMIAMLIKNLISNAIKYNNENGYVKINLSETDDSITIRIKDNGIGIAKENQDKVFERFYRVDESRTIKEGEESSTGLGLSIVKQIVNKYNGSIKIESELNKGTEFIITFKK